MPAADVGTRSRHLVHGTRKVNAAENAGSPSRGESLSGAESVKRCARSDAPTACCSTAVRGARRALVLRPAAESAASPAQARPVIDVRYPSSAGPRDIGVKSSAQSRIVGWAKGDQSVVAGCIGIHDPLWITLANSPIGLFKVFKQNDTRSVWSTRALLKSYYFWRKRDPRETRARIPLGPLEYSRDGDAACGDVGSLPTQGPQWDIYRARQVLGLAFLRPEDLNS